MFLGGYQLIDCTGITLTDSAVTVENAKIAEILRETDKPVQFTNLTKDSMKISALAVMVTDNGARDGKVYYMGPNYTVTTDDRTVTFTPIE